MTAPLRDPINRVSKNAIKLWLLESLIGFVLMVGGSFLLAQWLGSTDWPWVPGWIGWLPVVTAVVFGPLGVLEPVRRYAVHRWELADDVVYARSGWIDRKWVFVPVSRIQTVDKEQGVMERMFGLATVEIRTASHAGSSSIKGLDYDVAAALAGTLAQRAEALRDDAT
ncbi:PH domain-containing protein [Sinosporangium siamense]|uniref:Membrane protein n=1 Tax=Sinosporangium siamense TaxID=1367973 RepID=A0A919REJ9_9ACTN|nr:PH domain-containing protein [Sinosporangium siamense]GII91962.1 membrane protein [Sinosporangium siamense]